MNLERWDAFVAAHPGGNILQTSRWAQLKAESGWDWEIVTSDAAPLDAGALVLYRKLLRGLFTLAYVPRGPLVDWRAPDKARALLRKIVRAARRHRALALWIEPELFDTSETRATLQGLGLSCASHTVQPPRTILIDISQSEDEILARMKSKTRYNIRLSARKGVTVREGTLDDFAAFYDLMRETGARDDFGIHDELYYRKMLEIFLPQRPPPADQAALFLADVEGDVVAALIVFALGTTAWYITGASGGRHRKKMPTYALQWAAIRWAKARGCTTYDMWGIPDADEETLEAQFIERSDGLWGVYRFKRGFGGEVVRYIGLWERVLNPLYPLAARLRGYGDHVT